MIIAITTSAVVGIQVVMALVVASDLAAAKVHEAKLANIAKGNY